MTYKIFTRTWYEGACSHKDIIYCKDPVEAIRGHHTLNLANFKVRIKNHLHGLDKAKKPEKYMEPAKHVYDQCVEYCKLFEIEIPKDITEIIESVDNGQYKEYLKNERIRLENYRKEQIQLELLKFNEDLAGWYKESSHNLWNNPIDKIYFRLNNGEIETSKGIKIPVNVALRYYNQLKSNELKVGSKILDYTVKSVNEEMLVVSCHNILIKDFEEFLEKSIYAKEVNNI